MAIDVEALAAEESDPEEEVDPDAVPPPLPLSPGWTGMMPLESKEKLDIQRGKIPDGLIHFNTYNKKIGTEGALLIAEDLEVEDSHPKWDLTIMRRLEYDDGPRFPYVLKKDEGIEEKTDNWGIAISTLPNVTSITIGVEPESLFSVVGFTTDPNDDITLAHGRGFKMNRIGLFDANDEDIMLPASDYTRREKIELTIKEGLVELWIHYKAFGERVNDESKQLDVTWTAQAPAMYAKVFIVEPEVFMRVPRTRTCTLVQRLNLVGNAIGDEGLMRLVTSLDRESCLMNELQLEGNRLSCHGVVKLSELLEKDRCRITKVNLGHNGIGCHGAARLAEACSKESCVVEELGLSDNLINDPGAKKIAEVLELSTCRVRLIKLAMNRICDGGMVRLAEAIESEACSITEIKLGMNRATADGTRRLAQAFACTPRLAVC